MHFLVGKRRGGVGGICCAAVLTAGPRDHRQCVELKTEGGWLGHGCRLCALLSAKGEGGPSPPTIQQRHGLDVWTPLSPPPINSSRGVSIFRIYACLPASTAAVSRAATGAVRAGVLLRRRCSTPVPPGVLRRLAGVVDTQLLRPLRRR